MKQNKTKTYTNGGSLQILKKLGIILGAVAVLIFIINFIPAKRVTENNLLLQEHEDDGVLIMAEKGGYVQNPENTRKAFDQVIKSSSYTDIVELDIRTTADGVLVIIEDETINALALKPSTEENPVEDVYVKDTNLVDLKKYNLGNNFVDVNGKKPYENITTFSAQGLSIFTFEEFLNQYKSSRTSVYYIVDFQETGDRGIEAVKKAHELLEKEEYDSIQRRTMFSTSDKELLKHISNEYSDYALSGQGKYTKALINACKLGYRQLVTPVYTSVQVNMKEKAFLGINFNLAKKSFMSKIEEKNMTLIFVNVSTEEEVRILYEMNAHVIGTGNPKFVDSIFTKIQKEEKENA